MASLPQILMPLPHFLPYPYSSLKAHIWPPLCCSPCKLSVFPLPLGCSASFFKCLACGAFLIWLLLSLPALVTHHSPHSSTELLISLGNASFLTYRPLNMPSFPGMLFLSLTCPHPLPQTMLFLQEASLIPIRLDHLLCISLVSCVYSHVAARYWPCHFSGSPKSVNSLRVGAVSLRVGAQGRISSAHHIS